MRCFLALLSILYCGLAYAQNHGDPTRRRPFDDSIQFPKENDIYFPSPNDEPASNSNMYKIRDFSYNTDHAALPKPKHRTRDSAGAPKPGQPFPPAPRGHRGRNRNNNNRQQRRLCERKYSEYVERIFPNDTAIREDANDDDLDGRVLARPGQYPHMAAIGFQTLTEVIEFKCGGSLISENVVLTAAHCAEVEGMAPFVVRIGGLNLMVSDNNVENIAVDSISTHPDYSSDSYYNDIALLKLQENIVLTEFVRPIRLWVRPELPTSIAFAMGYGATSFGRTMTNRLTHLNATILSNDECNRDLPAFADASQGIIESQICAQDFVMNRDTCQGDSGGPLQLNLPGRRRRNHIHYHLIGITSFGVFCRSNYPSVYTRVHSYLDWIEQLTWGNQ